MIELGETLLCVQCSQSKFNAWEQGGYIYSETGILNPKWLHKIEYRIREKAATLPWAHPYDINKGRERLARMFVVDGEEGLFRDSNSGSLMAWDTLNQTIISLERADQELEALIFDPT